MKLTVITKKFPYFNTEAFLENEVSYLNKTFEKVIFLPIIKGNVRKMSFPVNICDSYNSYYQKKIQYSLYVLFSCHFYQSVFNHWDKVFRKNYLKQLFLQDIHYRILRNVILDNPELFDGDTVVYSYWFNSVVYALLRLRDKYGYKYKVVCRAHRYDVYDLDGEMPNRSYCLSKIDRIFPISQDAINYFTDKYGFNTKFQLARLGVSDPCVCSKGSSEGSFNVLSVSQVSERKRVTLIFHSLYEMAKKYPDISIQWTLFGDGPLDDKMRQLQSSINVPNFKVILMGRVPNRAILDYYSKSEIDCFVNLSSSEGVPVSVMEALSYGIPCIATNVGGTAEIMNEHNGCLLSDSPTEESVIEAYEIIYNSNLNRTKIREDWNQIANANKNFPEFVRILSQI